MSEVNYNDGKWHGWNGGECPVHPLSTVSVRFRAREREFYACDEREAENWRWTHNNSTVDIIAFRVIKDHKKPREFWIGNDAHLGLPDIKTVETKGYIHVREVL